MTRLDDFSTSNMVEMTFIKIKHPLKALIMDFATLTGAAIVALGVDKTAVFNKGVSTHILDDILTQARIWREPTFELPITATERKQIKK
ncbi:hypothetical protein GLV92_12110, partial [Staphylococcus agnetis]|nr:hypothetical protein [Staphylococcus agnetis]